ncbi:MAG: hypothetical protein RQ767_01205 [Thermovirgaceae bacterium]|nr:hypothetical protein [Thermovirgaceae bacterium]
MTPFRIGSSRFVEVQCPSRKESGNWSIGRRLHPRATVTPREEHLIPLHVCAGMAGTQASLIFDDRILDKRGVAFIW